MKDVNEAVNKRKEKLHMLILE